MCLRIKTKATRCHQIEMEGFLTITIATINQAITDQGCSNKQLKITYFHDCDYYKDNYRYALFAIIKII